MEGIFDNIMGGQDIEDLFTDQEGTEENETKPEDTEGEENKAEEQTTDVDDSESIFDEDELQESVGSEKNTEGKGNEDTSTGEAEETSPNNFYSSIANALAVDGIFPNLDDETIKKATDAESFCDLIEAEINARLDEKQQRISKALENGVEPSDIKKYENILANINSINDALISEESEKGEQLRRNLIYQDFINKGYNPEKAKKLTERTIDAGTDVEDAKEALQGNKDFFQSQYNRLLQEAQEEADKQKADRQKQAEKLKESILKDKQLIGDLELSGDVRKKAYDIITKPVYKDAETGQYMTALQKYQTEHKSDFLKYVGLVMALTNDFKDFDSFTKGKVKKEVKKGLRDLEQTLNNTRRDANGNLKMVTSKTEDPETWYNNKIKLVL